MFKFFERFLPKTKPNRYMVLYRELENNYNKLDKIKTILDNLERKTFKGVGDFYANIEKLCFDDMPSLSETDEDQLVKYLISKQVCLELDCHSIIEKMTNPQTRKT